MPTQLGEAFVPIRATLDKLDGDLDQARSKVENAMSSIGKVASNLTDGMQKIGTVALAGIGVLGAAAAGAAVGIVSLASAAEPLIGLQKGFEATVTRIGSSTDVMLRSLQDSSGELITNRDLMKSFNTAAALVSDDFAKRLPDAMVLVRKASLSTGQDMGFLFDSLVKGVGRISPMILDNLGIQVSLTEVTERASKMFGKQADALSKQEQQAALTEVIMEKLSKTYGDVPDVAPTFAKFGVVLQNLKDDIGLQLLPVLLPLAEKLLDIAKNVLPILVGIFENSVVPAIGTVTDFIGRFLDRIQDLPSLIEEGFTPLEAIGEVLKTFFPDDMEEKIDAITSGLSGFIEQVVAFAQPIIDFIMQNVNLQDVLIALGVVIASVIIPIVISLISTVAPLVLLFVGIVAAIALLRNAWESDFGGIRTMLTGLFEKVILPNFEILRAWLAENLPKALQILSDFWTNVLKPAIDTVFAWIQGTLFPWYMNVWVPLIQEKMTKALQILSDFWTNTLQPAIMKVWNWLSTVLLPFIRDQLIPWLRDNFTKGIQVLSDFWTNTLLPAITKAWEYFNDHILPIIRDVIGIMDKLGAIAITALAGFWENILKPALEKVWKFFNDNILPVLKDVRDFIVEEIGPKIIWFKEHVIDPLAKAVGEGLTNALDWVKQELGRLKDLIDNFKLPSWLKPGSPTPFELGLRGIAKAMDDLNRKSANVPVFNMSPTSAYFLPNGSGSEESSSVNYSSTTTVYTNQDPMRVLRASRHLDKLGAIT